MSVSLASIFGPRSDIAEDDDLVRVRALARRPHTDEAWIAALSAALRKRSLNDDGEPNMLRPEQASALRELLEVGGLFAPMRVGSGKTLVTLLAATLLLSKRPVLLIPANLRDKTRRDFAQYHRDWAVRLPEIISYTELGHPRNETLLLDKAPDLLMLDEAHHTRNLDAAVTRRVKRAIVALAPVVAVLSGTLITDKLMDSHHHAVWSLNERAPVPMTAAAAERWSQAVDREVGLLKRVGEGALETLPGGFHEWMRGSRGVVPTAGQDCDAAIEISSWTAALNGEARGLIEQVQRSGMRPDGELLDEWELPDCLCQLALRFYYVWDPMPPDWWLRPRRAFRAYVRAILDEHLEGFDSESQVVTALDNDGSVPYANEGRQILAEWREVRDTFVPNMVPVWLGSDVLEQVARDAGPGCLIWTRYRAVGHALEKLGVPYYGGGTNPESAPRGSTIACSINAHGTGKNLQHGWHRSLVLTPMANADAWEQLIGRTHRKGQKADCVGVRVNMSIPYHADVLSRVRTEAKRISKASGFEHKLCLADWV